MSWQYHTAPQIKITPRQSQSGQRKRNKELQYLVSKGYDATHTATVWYNTNPDSPLLFIAAECTGLQLG